MSNLTLIEKRRLEKLFEMGSGCVLDFSNRTFQEFVVDSTGRNILDPAYDYASCSKANRLRAFWSKEPNHVVAKLTSDLLDKLGEHRSQSSVLYAECRRIAERLLQDASVSDIDAIAPRRRAKGGRSHDRRGN